MDDLIDQFDLLSQGEENDIDTTEINDLQEEYTRRMVAFKILHPDDPLPDIPVEIKANMEPLPSMVSSASSVLERIKSLFPLEVVDRLRVGVLDAAKRG